MKKTDVKIGSTYRAKVTNKVVDVRIDAVNPHGGWDATNLATNKKVRIKSAQRLRAKAGSEQKQPKAQPQKPPAKKRDRMSGLDAAVKVLKEASCPLDSQEMVTRMISKGYWKTKGKTPHATIYSAIIREIAKKGKDARFKKTERGKFSAAS